MPSTAPAAAHTRAVLTAQLRLRQGGESVPRLRDELARVLPPSRLTELPVTEDEWLPRLTWEHPAQEPYGTDCFTTWSTFCHAVEQAWGRAAAEEDLDGARFQVCVDGRPVGHLERREAYSDLRDTVDDRPLSCGQGLELLLPDGTWLAGRYEMAQPGREAMFYTAVWGAAIGFAITPAMVLRHPVR